MVGTWDMVVVVVCDGLSLGLPKQGATKELVKTKMVRPALPDRM